MRQAQGQPRFLPVSSCTMDNSRLSGLIEGRTDGLEGFGGFVLLAGAHQLQVLAFEGMQARLDAPVVQAFASAIPHPTLG